MALKVSQLAFAAQPGKDILRDVSFELSAGQSLAIVGPIGAGKTVLLRDNLTPCGDRNEWPDAALQRALDLANLSQDVAQWPGGLDTEIGERGLNLSGG